MGNFFFVHYLVVYLLHYAFMKAEHVTQHKAKRLHDHFVFIDCMMDIFNLKLSKNYLNPKIKLLDQAPIMVLYALT